MFPTGRTASHSERTTAYAARGLRVPLGMSRLSEYLDDSPDYRWVASDVLLREEADDEQEEEEEEEDGGGDDDDEDEEGYSE